MRSIAKKILGVLCNMFVCDIKMIVVDYDKKVEAFLKQATYNFSDPDITTEHFPAPKHGKQEVMIELIRFGRIIRDSEAIRELDQMGLLPGDISLLWLHLALWVRFRTATLVSPGSVGSIRSG